MSKKSKIRVGFIGCGGNARGHGRNIIQQPDVEIVGLADVSETAIQAFRESVGVPAKVPAFADYQKMLATVKPDAVEISTPHTLHFPQIMGLPTPFPTRLYVLPQCRPERRTR